MQKEIQHIEYCKGYKNATNDISIYLKNLITIGEIKINKNFVLSLCSLFIKYGFEKIRDSDLYINTKNEVFIDSEECKKSNVKKKRKR